MSVYEISKEIRIRRNDSKVVNTLMNICENYIKLKDISKCEEILREINSYLKEGDVENLIDLNLIWYRIYTLKELFKEAEYVLLDTYDLAKKSNLQKQAGQLAIMIGKFYIDNKKEVEAAKYLDEGVNIFRKLGILKN